MSELAEMAVAATFESNLAYADFGQPSEHHRISPPKGPGARTETKPLQGLRREFFEGNLVRRMTEL